MRRTGLLIGGWALATVLALVLGLQSVSAISDSVTGRPRKTLSPSSVRAALDRSASSESSESSESSQSSDSSESAESAESKGSPDEGRSSSGSSASFSSASTGVSGDDGGASSSSVSSSDDGVSSNGDGDGGSSSSQGFPPPQDQTFDSQGGTVTVRFENGQAHLLLVTAHDGFSCENDSNSSSVDVRCTRSNPQHESRIRAFWNDGPQHTVEEKD